MFNSSLQPSLNLLKTLPDLLAQICVYINYIWRKYLLQTIFNIQVSSEVFDKTWYRYLQQIYYFRTLNSKFEAFNKTTACIICNPRVIYIDFQSLCTQIVV